MSVTKIANTPKEDVCWVCHRPHPGFVCHMCSNARFCASSVNPENLARNPDDRHAVAWRAHCLYVHGMDVNLDPVATGMKRGADDIIPHEDEDDLPHVISRKGQENKRAHQLNAVERVAEATRLMSVPIASMDAYQRLIDGGLDVTATPEISDYWRRRMLHDQIRPLFTDNVLVSQKGAYSAELVQGLEAALKRITAGTRGSAREQTIQTVLKPFSRKMLDKLAFQGLSEHRPLLTDAIMWRYVKLGGIDLVTLVMLEDMRNGAPHSDWVYHRYISFGADVESHPELLARAVRCLRPGLVALFIEHNADYNSHSFDRDASPLHQLCRHTQQRSDSEAALVFATAAEFFRGHAIAPTDGLLPLQYLLKTCAPTHLGRQVITAFLQNAGWLTIAPEDFAAARVFKDWSELNTMLETYSAWRVDAIKAPAAAVSVLTKYLEMVSFLRAQIEYDGVDSAEEEENYIRAVNKDDAVGRLTALRTLGRMTIFNLNWSLVSWNGGMNTIPALLANLTKDQQGDVLLTALQNNCQNLAAVMIDILRGEKEIMTTATINYLKTATWRNDPQTFYILLISGADANDDRLAKAALQTSNLTIVKYLCGQTYLDIINICRQLNDDPVDELADMMDVINFKDPTTAPGGLITTATSVAPLDVGAAKDVVAFKATAHTEAWQRIEADKNGGLTTAKDVEKAAWTFDDVVAMEVRKKAAMNYIFSKDKARANAIGETPGYLEVTVRRLGVDADNRAALLDSMLAYLPDINPKILQCPRAALPQDLVKVLDAFGVK